MMDSARTRTVGSSSTTGSVAGLAFLDFIRATPLAPKRQPWGKSKVPTLAVILQLRLQLWHLCSGNSDLRKPERRTCPTVLGVEVHFVARINIRAQSSL